MQKVKFIFHLGRLKPVHNVGGVVIQLFKKCFLYQQFSSSIIHSGAMATALNVFWRLWYQCSNKSTYVLLSVMILSIVSMFWWYSNHKYLDTILAIISLDRTQIHLLRHRYTNHHNTFDAVIIGPLCHSIEKRYGAYKIDNLSTNISPTLCYFACHICHLLCWLVVFDHLSIFKV